MSWPYMKFFHVSVFVKCYRTDEGMSEVVQIEDDDEDLDEQPTPKSRGGEEKNVESRTTSPGHT